MDRTAFINYILAMYKKLESDNPTIKLLKDRFNEMSDSELESLRDALENEELYLPFFRPNYNEKSVDINSWLDLADEVGAEIFAKVWKEDKLTGDVVLSQYPYWIALLPVRRMIQYLNDKISISENNNVRDSLTGQVTGDSKSSALSNPQLNALIARGCPAAATEFVKLRSGDVEVSRAYNRQIIKEGRAYQEPLLKLDSRPEVTETFKNYLISMHLSTTL